MLQCLPGCVDTVHMRLSRSARRIAMVGAVCAFTLSLVACQGNSSKPSSRPPTTQSSLETEQQVAAVAASTVPSGFRKWPVGRAPACPDGSITVGCWSSLTAPAATAAVIRRSVIGAGYTNVAVTCADPQRYCIVHVRTQTSMFTYRLERLHAHGSANASSWTGLRSGTRVWLVAVPG